MKEIEKKYKTYAVCFSKANEIQRSRKRFRWCTAEKRKLSLSSLDNNNNLEQQEKKKLNTE